MKSRANILFITGTDTGVGKTVFTALLLDHLRRTGKNALAMKPFCSGDRTDVAILHELQQGAISMDEINPWYFPDPVAPASSRIADKVAIRKADVVRSIRRMSERCDLLLVEGCGGLMVPITGRFLVVDVIDQLQCGVVLIGTNKLGVLNHTLLSVEALKGRGIKRLSVVLMDTARRDLAARSNPAVLKEWLGSISLGSLPYLVGDLSKAVVIRGHSRKLRRLIPDLPI